MNMERLWGHIPLLCFAFAFLGFILGVMFVHGVEKPVVWISALGGYAAAASAIWIGIRHLGPLKQQVALAHREEMQTNQRQLIQIRAELEELDREFSYRSELMLGFFHRSFFFSNPLLDPDGMPKEPLARFNWVFDTAERAARDLEAFVQGHSNPTLSGPEFRTSFEALGEAASAFADFCNDMRMGHQMEIGPIQNHGISSSYASDWLERLKDDDEFRNISLVALRLRRDCFLARDDLSREITHIQQAVA